MDSQYIVLSDLLSDQAAFITSPKTSFANYWGHCPPCPPPPSVYGPAFGNPLGIIVFHKTYVSKHLLTSIHIKSHGKKYKDLLSLIQSAKSLILKFYRS